MTRITADDELRKKLLNFTEDVEICDEQGFVLAKVQRSNPFNDPSHWEEISPPLTQDEYLEALNSDEGGITTAELVAYLRGL